MNMHNDTHKLSIPYTRLPSFLAGAVPLRFPIAMVVGFALLAGRLMPAFGAWAAWNESL